MITWLTIENLRRLELLIHAALFIKGNSKDLWENSKRISTFKSIALFYCENFIFFFLGGHELLQ